mmetsp:Transcript_42024/g.136365  ORF Transcript_42024/g.136365 Transcript_42024/m.136365 type:complete len:350 (-) Transcript_42024:303-1352(-)
MGPPHRVSLGPQRVPAVQSSVRDHSRPPHSTPAPAPPPPHRPRFCRLRAGSGDCAAMVRPLHVGPAVDPVAARHAHLPLAGPALAHRRAQLGGRRRRLGGGGGLGAGWGRALLVPAQGEVAPRRCARVRGRQALRHRIQRALRAADLVGKLVCGGGGRGPALWPLQPAFPRPLAHPPLRPPNQPPPGGPRVRDPLRKHRRGFALVVARAALLLGLHADGGRLGPLLGSSRDARPRRHAAQAVARHRGCRAPAAAPGRRSADGRPPLLRPRAADVHVRTCESFPGPACELAGGGAARRPDGSRRLQGGSRAAASVGVCALASSCAWHAASGGGRYRGCPQLRATRVSKTL